jgi:hypothetical protein
MRSTSASSPRSETVWGEPPTSGSSSGASRDGTAGRGLSHQLRALRPQAREVGSASQNRCIVPSSGPSWVEAEVFATRRLGVDVTRKLRDSRCAVPRDACCVSRCHTEGRALPRDGCCPVGGRCHKEPPEAQAEPVPAPGTHASQGRSARCPSSSPLQPARRDTSQPISTSGPCL